MTMIGNTLGSFRAETERQRTMPGVTLPSFRCTACRKTRGITGRRQRVPGDRKSGFVCATCAGGTT